ncbi:MAG: MATE family efflux transporter [Bacteroides cellulosilyticus]|nr:MATE family efflux transporter [Bacteroides cellulosilyticus]
MEADFFVGIIFNKINEVNMDQRDAIDFGKTDISKLFVKIFIPTLLGLMFGASVYLADGIFVGNGIGAEALAAVNIVTPLYLISTGLALMFGSGVSVVVAIHLSHRNYKAANINVTQAITVSTTIMLVICAIVFLFPERTARLFGSSPKLMPLVTEYMCYALPSFLGSMLLVVGMFIIRLDGSPKFAMYSNVIASVLNIALDYIYVFPLGMGVKGAAIATSMSQCAGAVIVLIYMFRYSETLHLYPPKFTRTSVGLTLRNTGYMVKLGLPTFIGETAMACLMLVGNIMFMRRLQEAGVAAFAVACYVLPLVFLFGNAVAQSALPIISYNYGTGDKQRIARTFRMSVWIAAIFGLLISLIGIVGKQFIIETFITDSSHAYDIALYGFPYYAASFVFLILNIVLIGYLQSKEQFKSATVFMLLRGYLFIIPCFVWLPSLLGDNGLWLAVTVSELLTFGAIILYLLCTKNKK